MFKNSSNQLLHANIGYLKQNFLKSNLKYIIYRVAFNIRVFKQPEKNMKNKMLKGKHLMKTKILFAEIQGQTNAR